MRKMLLIVVMAFLFCLSIVSATFLYSAGDYFYVFVGLICCIFYGICTVKAIKKR